MAYDKTSPGEPAVRLKPSIVHCQSCPFSYQSSFLYCVLMHSNDNLAEGGWVYSSQSCHFGAAQWLDGIKQSLHVCSHVRDPSDGIPPFRSTGFRPQETRKQNYRHVEYFICTKTSAFSEGYG